MTHETEADREWERTKEAYRQARARYEAQRPVGERGGLRHIAHVARPATEAVPAQTTLGDGPSETIRSQYRRWLDAWTPGAAAPDPAAFGIPDPLAARRAEDRWRYIERMTRDRPRLSPAEEAALTEQVARTRAEMATWLGAPAGPGERRTRRAPYYAPIQGGWLEFSTRAEFDAHLRRTGAEGYYRPPEPMPEIAALAISEDERGEIG